MNRQINNVINSKKKNNQERKHKTKQFLTFLELT